MRLLPARTHRLSIGWLVLGLGSVVVAGLFTAWVGQQAWAVHKLKRGVGDTWFHAADGQQWFRLDERRRDVPLSRISPHLQHAFIAVKDHRFYRHPGVGSIALSRAVFRNLRQQFRNRMGGDHPPDWRVDTTIDASLQQAAKQAVEQGLCRAGRASLQAALVVLDPATGDVIAMVGGGRDYGQSPFNRATRARRQPGSAFKPLLYAAALADGFSPVSTLDGLDAPPPEGTGDWTPRNADGATSDVMTLRAALRTSNNRAAAALQQRVGGRRVLALASRAGVRDQPLVPSLSLGTGLVTPLDLTAAYALFPNGGFAVRPRGILRIVDDDGSVAFTTPVHRERVVTPQVAFQMVSMLTDVLDHGTGAPARRLGVRFPAGGKTGTTNDGKDVWFVGFSAGLVAGVWVGFDQPETLGPNASGARYALPIWADFMRQASRVRPPVAFERPAGLEEERLCRESFLQPVDGCPTYIELLTQGDATPNRLCPLHRGSAKQRATRTVQGWAAEVGRRIRDIFR
jgi:penicillin-binding protein 1A